MSNAQNQTTDDQRIYDHIEERYGKLANSGDSCCGDSCGCDSSSGLADGLYDFSVLDDLPVDITNLSLGCGDPVTIAGIESGETVLDLGSGAGMDCFLAARQVGASGKVIGVDMTTEMLQRAEKNKARLGTDNVEFRRGRIEDLPVEDHSVDLIMSNCVINLSPRKEAVFAEAFRVLKAGGRVSISDIVTEGDFSEELRADVDQWSACASGAIHVDDYTRMIREAGFTDVTIVSKDETSDEVVPQQAGMPTLYSARITARKPADA